MTVPVSVVVLTLNEEGCIQRCLRQLLPWAGEVVVVDSGSTDRTVEIAKAAGARVIEQPWLGWVPQHNVGIDAAAHDWCMKVDADEVVNDALAAAIIDAILADPDPRTMFIVRRVEEFAGVLLPSMRRRSKGDTFVRIFNRRTAGFDADMLIHEEVVGDGPRVALGGCLLHWRNFTLDQRFTQNNRNATLEAQALALANVRWSGLRMATKPVLRFLWCYLYCGGWRAGTPGLVYSLNAASAEFMRQAKLWEFQAVKPSRHPPERLYRSQAAVQADIGPLDTGAQN